MSTVDDIAAEEHHHHGEFIAHHFESAEQQFDSGKLGIWVFLVTEILFFSGLFCAYVLYRYHNPEMFVTASVFLDKVLGMGNTIVLLFSSLTMALAVRASQTGNNKQVANLTLITMVCAAVFLGVKAVEYSHKWDLLIFTRGSFAMGTEAHPAISKYLIILSVIPIALIVIFPILGFVFKSTAKPALGKFFLGMSVMVGGYFLGVAGGYVYQNYIVGSSHSDGSHAAHATDHGAAHAEGEGAHAEGDAAHSEGDAHGHGPGEAELAAQESRDIGIFFSIYYCMTGLHAFHIIGGIIALAWIYYRAILGHFRSDYFGPVDNVGLYWHLVDLIWIFLFPLLYLIN